MGKLLFESTIREEGKKKKITFCVFPIWCLPHLVSTPLLVSFPLPRVFFRFHLSRSYALHGFPHFVKHIRLSLFLYPSCQFLNPSVAHKKWFIYETPGICKFDPQKRLSDCNLIPCALLRFKVDPAQDDEAHNSFLSDDAIAKYFVKS